MKKAFTLAEVLVTLGIIGVVAALTIPTLVNNYQSRAWDTASSVFERKLEEALKIMNTQSALAGYSTTKDFVKELSKHLNIVKICENSKIHECFAETVKFGNGDTEPEDIDISKIKTSKNFGKNDWAINTDVLGFQLNNGTNGLIAYNTNCKQDPFSNQITGTDCIAVLYDTSGFSKPNTSGKDLRSINISKLGSSCAADIGGTCFGQLFTPDPLSKAECTELLGADQCKYDTNYWAGAVKACGGSQNIATLSHITEIARYIYNDENLVLGYLGESIPSVANPRDDSKASTLGIGSNESRINFLISNSNTLNVVFETNEAYIIKSSGGGGSAGGNPQGKAICIIN